MRIRLTNPHAQSKDPCTLIRNPGRGREFFPHRRAQEIQETGKGTSSTRAASVPEPETRLQPLRYAPFHPDAEPERRAGPVVERTLPSASSGQASSAAFDF